MKKYVLLLISISMMFLSSCRSIDINKQIAKKRQELYQQEIWRHQIPKEEKQPVRPVFPVVKKAVLENGLTVLVVEDHKLPIAEISLVFKNGSAKDPDGLAGLNHLTSMMLKEGTSSLTSLELAEAFANLGTQVSVGVNKDMSQISAAVLSHKVDQAVQLISDMIKNPRMAAEDFARVKLQHQNLLASFEAVQSYVAQINFLQAAYGDKHVYAYPSAGILRTVNKITLEKIKSIHQSNFGSNNAALLVVGDVTLEQIKTSSKKHFGSWKKSVVITSKISDPKIKKQMETHLVARKNSPQTYLLVGRAIVTQHDKDLAALEVFQKIIAGLPTSRLDANLREKKGWTYGVSSLINPLLGKGPIMITTSIQVPFGADALKEILAEFERLRKNLVADDELKTAKNGLLNSFAGRYNTLGKISSVIADQFIYNLPPNNDQILYEQIDKVSKQDLLQIARRVLDKDDMVAVAVGELEVMELPIAKMDVGKVIIKRENESQK
jgi:zinc protease